MGRVFGTRAAREHAALYSDKPDTAPAYPNLPRSLNRFLFETPLTVSERHNQYVVILGTHFVPATDVDISKWLLREYGDHLNNEQFKLAQDLLITKVSHTIEYEQTLKKRRTEFTYQNWLNGYI